MPLPTIPPVTKLSPLVLRVLGHNPGSFQLQGTNLYLVGNGPSRILIDTGEGKKEDLPLLLQAMEDDGCVELSDVLITHYHHDHTEGIKDLRALFGEALNVWKLPWAPGILVPWQKVEHGPSFDMAALGVKILADGDVLKTTGATLVAVATPGHCIDHCCYLLEEESSLFSGDHVLGGSSGVFEDLHAYMRSLEKTLAILPKGRGGRIYPGHGVVLEDGHQGVCDYIANRRMREQQVLEALSGCRPSGLTPYGIVGRVYPALSLTLRIAASSNVERTLLKLQKDGRAMARNLSPFRFGWLDAGLGRLGLGVPSVLKKLEFFGTMLLKRWYLLR